jgi:hypothetical protein
MTEVETQPPEGAWSILSDEGFWSHGYSSSHSHPKVGAEWEDEAARRWWESDAGVEYIKSGTLAPDGDHSKPAPPPPQFVVRGVEIPFVKPR